LEQGRSGRAGLPHVPASSMAGLLLRGLYFAIIDEADSVLIDEARIPLIISAEKNSYSDITRYETALDIALTFLPDRHYRIAAEEKQVQWTSRGALTVGEQSSRFHGGWRSKRAREELVCKALMALQLLHKDKHYIIAEGKVQIVDEYPGRVMPARSWKRGCI